MTSEFLDGNPDVEIADETDLIEDAVLDSLGIFVLISFVEERFGIEVQPDEVTFENFQTVRSVADLVRAKQALASAS